MNYLKTTLALLIRLAVISVAILAVSPCFAAQQLLVPRTFHAEEVTAKSGESWIAVTADSKKRIALKINTVKDAVADEGNKKTGKQVVTPGIKSIFIVKNVPNVGVGKCTTVLNKETELWKKPAVNLVLGKKSYKIELKLKVGKAKEGDTYTPAHCALTVSDGTRTDTILDTDCVAELQGLEAPRILWAGDIDMDGKLDLLIDGSTESNMSKLMLFTSSPAKPGKILTKVGELTTYGC
ncbi:MAG: hypothetical protein K2X77_09050 [Candidatus Obscuribacterales bacterium]|nr:hypothetical protein [Candidatus Obscuribacterales bacterium]